MTLLTFDWEEYKRKVSLIEFEKLKSELKKERLSNRSLKGWGTKYRANKKTK